MENKPINYQPKNCELRIERIDLDNRDIAIELAKLGTAVNKIDTDIHKLIEIGSSIISIKYQISSIEDLLQKNHQVNEQQNVKLNELQDRLEDLEHASKTVKTAIKLIFAGIGLMLTQFSETVFNWITSHGK